MEHTFRWAGAGGMLRNTLSVGKPFPRAQSNVLVVGIELWRMTTLGFGGQSGSFRPGLSPTPIAHVSIGPPTIPDGRISRVRF